MVGAWTECLQRPSPVAFCVPGEAAADNPLIAVVDNLQAQLSATKAQAAEFEGKSLELGAELAVLERKQKNQVHVVCCYWAAGSKRTNTYIEWWGFIVCVLSLHAVR